MSGKGYVSESMFAGRILSHGKITSLATAFKLASETPFSIFVVPKANVSSGVISTPDNAGLIVSAKLYQEESASDIPVLFNQWTEAAILELPINAINTTTYDVYWGCGSYDAES